MKKISVLFCTLFLLFSSARSQFSYFSPGFSIIAGTYDDLGTQGSVIDSSAYTGSIRSANDVSIATPIGFTFNYNNRDFTHFFLATNGYIKLGSAAAPDSGVRNVQSSQADTNLIYPFNCRLEDAPGREFRVYTQGPPGSQVCTIQFKNLRDSAGKNYNSINFQIKLYQSGSKVEFVYGAFTAATPTAAHVLFPANVGMWGSNPQKTINLTKSSTARWDTLITALEIPYSQQTGNANRFNTRDTVLPVPGLTYQFLSTALSDNDAAVTNVFTLGAIPRIYGFPTHRVGARIQNKGLQVRNNLPVYLHITGANNFSDTLNIVSLNLESSADIYFDSIPGSGNSGADTIRVMVPSDDNTSNDISLFIRNVNDTLFSYPDNSPPSQSIGFGKLSGIMLVKYRSVSPVSVIRVQAYISNRLNNVGKQVYGVVYNGLQQSLAASSSITLDASNLGNYLSISFNPAVSVSGDFYVGLAQVGDSTNDVFPLGVQTEGPPTRRGAYFTASTTGVGVTEDTSKGRFMIQAIIFSGPVPVVLRQFDAEKKTNYNQLSWQTGQEINVGHYVLERSVQGVDFNTLAVVSASGLDKYIFNDMSPLRGLNYYRLRIVSSDGRELFSDIRMLRNAGKAEMLVFPNPASELFQVSYKAGAGSQGEIIIRDISGRRILRKTIRLTEGVNLFQYDASAWAPGVYSVTIMAEKEILTQTFIRQ